MTLSAVVVDVYHKEHLLTKEDVEKVNKCRMQWSEALPSKDAATATRISKILDKHGFEKKGQMMRGQCCMVGTVCSLLLV